ncbi:MAG TPA: hypothetical protein VFA99_05545 [Acidobacteriaceae bacterium]|nr:hypothetical protein [Acidobacteriaceae bacterium]
MLPQAGTKAPAEVTELRFSTAPGDPSTTHAVGSPFMTQLYRGMSGLHAAAALSEAERRTD